MIKGRKYKEMLSIKEWHSLIKNSLRKINAQNQLSFTKNARQQNDNVAVIEIF